MPRPLDVHKAELGHFARKELRGGKLGGTMRMLERKSDVGKRWVHVYTLAPRSGPVRWSSIAIQPPIFLGASKRDQSS